MTAEDYIYKIRQDIKAGLVCLYFISPSAVAVYLPGLGAIMVLKVGLRKVNVAWNGGSYIVVCFFFIWHHF